LGSWQNFYDLFGSRLSVLLYHRVGAATPTDFPGLTVSPEKFARQVRWLARRGFTAIRASDWLAWCREGKALPAKPVLLTFDDAFADLAQNALPVLKQYGYSGVVFLVTKCLGGTNTWDHGKWGTDHQIMSTDQVRNWASQGIEFGGHTRTHPDLTSLDEARVEEEVEGGAQDLARLLGARAVSFAYPYGEYNEAAQRCAQNAFALSFTCEEGLNDLTTPLHRLRRTMIDPNDSLIDFGPRVHWGYSPIRNLRARLRIRTRLKNALGLRTQKA
jgi:peptidoglycan/xylan/chitin deacetylase (PgdA/CDA1 family)